LPELKKEVEKLPKIEVGEEIERLKGDVGEIERLIEENKKQEEQH